MLLSTWLWQKQIPLHSMYVKDKLHAIDVAQTSLVCDWSLWIDTRIQDSLLSYFLCPTHTKRLEMWMDKMVVPGSWTVGTIGTIGKAGCAWEVKHILWHALRGLTSLCIEVPYLYIRYTECILTPQHKHGCESTATFPGGIRSNTIPWCVTTRKLWVEPRSLHCYDPRH